ncbi:MAG: cyclase family protein [Betaproteobacteria bacterium]|nr:cyclase family protein [Betaproteobacteria bacterium]
MTERRPAPARPPPTLASKPRFPPTPPRVPFSWRRNRAEYRREISTVSGNPGRCRTASLVIAASAACLLTSSPALAEPGTTTCAPSRWGKDDQIGSLNYVTPAKTLSASRLITRGKTYALGIQTNRQTPAFAPRHYSVVVLQPDQVNGVTFGPTKLSYNDDIVMGWNGVGSQIDGLGHVGTAGVYYNCNRGEDFAKATGLTRLGVETIPPIATRVIVLDMVSFLGKDGMVPEGTAFNRAEIENAMARQGILGIEKGDVVLFHTGWLQLIGKDDRRYATVEPGLGREGAHYLVEKGVAAVGADNWGLEVLPFEKGAGMFEVHQILLQQNGTFILEAMNTDEMIRDGVYEAFFTLGTPRISGAVQGIVNPVAIK